MKGPWQSLEEIPSLSAVAAEWREHTGTAFDGFKAGLLQKAGRVSKSYPCPLHSGCRFDVKPRGSAFVGICTDDDGMGCDDLALTADDLEVWEVSMSRLGRAIADALKIDAKETPIGAAGTRQIGSHGAAPLPILLTIQHGANDFNSVVTQLTNRLPTGFILLAPTSRFCTAATSEMLARINAGFLSLESLFTIAPDGKLQPDVEGKQLFVQLVSRLNGPSVASQEWTTVGRLSYAPDFNAMLVGGKPYDLRSHEKARSILKFLIEASALNSGAAKSLVEEIVPNIFKRGDYVPAKIEMKEFFKDASGQLAELRRSLVKPAGRSGKYYLSVFGD